MQAVSRQTAIKVVYWNGVAALIVVCLAGAAVLQRVHRHDRLIVETGRAYGVDPRLIASLIWKESRFKADAVGPAGEIGLMQVTEAAAQDWARAEGRPRPAKHELFNPETNLRAGTWYLARAIRRWTPRGDPLPFALAEYNAGLSNAERWARGARSPRMFLENITYPTTQRYVRDILRRYRGRV